jgi:hypothetical protein
MKIVFACILLASLQVHAEINDMDKQEIEKTIQGYVAGYQKHDFKKMRSFVTENFIYLTGGKKSWETKFKKASGSRGIKASNIQIEEKNNKVFIQFDAEEKMAHDSWFLVVRSGKKWLLDEPLNDFEIY